MYSGLSTSCPRLAFLSLRCSPWQPAGVLPAVHHHPLAHAKGQCQAGSSWQGPGRYSHSQSVGTAVPSTHLPSQWEPPMNRNLCLVDEVKIEKRNPAFPDTGRVWSEGHTYTHLCIGSGIRPEAQQLSSSYSEAGSGRHGSQSSLRGVRHSRQTIGVRARCAGWGSGLT